MSAQMTAEGGKQLTARCLLIAGGCLLVVAAAAAKLVVHRGELEKEARSMSTFVDRVPVRTVAPHRLDGRFLVASPGIVAPSVEMGVRSRLAGKVVSVPLQVGARVSVGTVLARLQGDGVSERFAATSYALDRSKHDKARLESARTYGGVSAQDVEASELALKQAVQDDADAARAREDEFVRSPIAGCVSSRTVDAGANVNIGDELFVVSSCSDVKISAQVAQFELERLNPGDSAVVRLDVSPEHPLGGTIARIAPKPDQAGNYAVEIRLHEVAGNPPRLGTTTLVEMVAAERAEKGLLGIPRRCLVGSALSPQVFVVQGDSVTLRAVVLGGRMGEQLVVRSGLAATDRVVADGQINLQGGTKIRVLK